MFGGTFDPAYTLNITAIDQHCQTTTNKRNTALLQNLLSDLLSVPLNRGLVRFNATPEECLAIGGRTIAADIEKSEVDNGVKGAHKRISAAVSSRKSYSGPTTEDKEKTTSKRRSLLFLRRNPIALYDGTSNDKEPDILHESGLADKLRTTVASDAFLSAGTSVLPLPESQLDVESQVEKKKLSSESTEDHLYTTHDDAPPPPRRNSARKNEPTPVDSRSKMDSRKASLSPQIPEAQQQPDQLKAFANYSGLTPTPIAKLGLEEPIKHGSTAVAALEPPKMPDTSSPKLSKRKSIIGIFSRRDNTAKVVS
jgi:hypothetical protein